MLYQRKHDFIATSMDVFVNLIKVQTETNIVNEKLGLVLNVTLSYNEIRKLLTYIPTI